jgi:tRNA(fMet)-specific endonuclease VapC
VKYILDTNVCIQILKGTSERIKTHIANIANDDIALPTVVRFELAYGVHKSQNPKKKQALIREFLRSFASIPFDDHIAEKCGEIRATLEKAGKPIGPYDLIIAATAVVKNFTLVTHNTKEFSRVADIKLEDWE